MPLEDLTGPAKFIPDLVASNPVGATDFLDDADDHIRGVKNVLLNTLPNLTGQVTSTHTELNLLDGATFTTVEANYLSGVTSAIQTQLDNLAAVGVTVNENFLDDIFFSFGDANDATFVFDSVLNALLLDMDLDQDFYIRDVNSTNETRFWFDVSVGDFHADGDVIAFSTSVGSDPKLKHDIEQIEDALKRIRSLKGVTFKWNKNDMPSAGLLSTDVEAALPEAVIEQEFMNGEGTYQSVNYNAVIGLLVEGIKTLDAKVRTLQRRASAG